MCFRLQLHTQCCYCPLLNFENFQKSEVRFPQGVRKRTQVPWLPARYWTPLPQLLLCSPLPFSAVQDWIYGSRKEDRNHGVPHLCFVGKEALVGDVMAKHDRHSLPRSPRSITEQHIRISQGTRTKNQSCLSDHLSLVSISFQPPSRGQGTFR